MAATVTLIPGDGIGPEVSQATVRMLEAVHGSAPDIVGQGIANPTAMMRSSILMLRHLGQKKAAERVKRGIYRVYEEGCWLTRDVGGKASTEEFTSAVIDAME